MMSGFLRRLSASWKREGHWLTIILASLMLVATMPIAPLQANMPGTYQPMLLAQQATVSGALDCSGGTITTSGVNRIHTFTAGGTLTCSGTGTATYLVIAAGGGGGATGNGGGAGGGGAGGYLAGTTTLVAGAYAITVGAGGAGGDTSGLQSGFNGGNSSLGTVATALGGGGGATTAVNGLAGGSGGGGTAYTSASSGGAGTAGQGNAGGAGGPYSGNYTGGGGGGAGAVGAAGATTVAGNGGTGLSSSISGSSVCYAGGGGGGTYLATGSAGTGTCGGGTGALGSAPSAGTANRGGGGGGGGYTTFVIAGASGGSGIVYVSYPSIRNPVSLGTTSNAASATTLALTATSAIVAGDLVAVSVGHLTASGTTVTGVSDGTNTYVRAGSGTQSTTQEAELWYCVNCLAVASPVITATFSATAASRVVGATRVAGGITALDAAPVGVGSASASPTVSTGPLSSNFEIVIGFLHINSNPTVTEGAGFTQIFNENASATTNHLAYQTVTANSSVSYSPTEGTSNANVIIVASFK